MAVTVETLEKLERKITLSVPVTTIQSEVDTRLKRLARTVKMDGFRPGKVPMNVVAQRYGYSVQYEVLNDKVVRLLPWLRTKPTCAWPVSPHHRKEGAPEGQVTFDAVFEVFPEVKIADLSDAEVESVRRSDRQRHRPPSTSCASSAARFAQRARTPPQDGDRVTVDFEGKIDGEPFDGGKAEDFQFLVGEGQMLKEFEDAVRGMKSGREQDLPLAFPPTTTARTCAGKTADFLVTIKKIEGSPPARSERRLRQVAGHCRRHRPWKACAPTSRRTWSAKSSSACWPATSKRRDGRAGGQGRAGSAQRQRAGRNRPS